MYESFYGLTAKPFSLLPDPGFLYLSRRHRRALTLLEYGILTQAGFVVITGDVGSGKTTLIRRYLGNAGNDVALGVITNPSATMGGLMQWVSSAFELSEEGTDVVLYSQFIKYLLDQYAGGKRTVLIVDEAQNLLPPMLEELRMLSNVNNDKDQVLQIVLVGQPELLRTLQQPDLRQFVQRVVVHCHLDALAPHETAEYIRFRLNVAGGAADIFDDLACAAVFHFTQGVPRLINLLCDQAMVYGYSDELRSIDYRTVAAVASDRNSAGLSAFNVVPEAWHAESMPLELQSLVDQIERGVA